MSEEQRKRAQLRERRKKVEAVRLVGDAQDLLPFAWKTPPVCTKPTKVMQALSAANAAKIRNNK